MTNETNSRPAAFIDRDGTLIEEVNFLSRVEDLRLFSYTAEALQTLKERGFLIIVVTNQSGIGRDIYTVDDMHSIHREMERLLPDTFDAFHFCPHLPCDGCACRKPGLGMIESAMRDLRIDLSRSWMIGDKRIDVETGMNAGIKSAMVMTGYGRRHVNELEKQPTVTAENLLEAVKQIVNFEQVEAAR